MIPDKCSIWLALTLFSHNTAKYHTYGCIKCIRTLYSLIKHVVSVSEDCFLLKVIGICNFLVHSTLGCNHHRCPLLLLLLFWMDSPMYLYLWLGSLFSEITENISNPLTLLVSGLQPARLYFFF